MIKQIKAWIVICDKCGKNFSASDNIYDCFNSKKEAIEIITGEDWQVKGEKVYCENCRSY